MGGFRGRGRGEAGGVGTGGSRRHRGLWTAFAGSVPPWLDGVLAGLLGLAATHRLLWPGFPVGHDTFSHLWGLYGFYQAILAGNVLPPHGRWVERIIPGAMFSILALDFFPYGGAQL